MLFVSKQKQIQKKGVVIAIVHHKNDSGKALNENMFDLPFVMGNGGSELYYLVHDVSGELENFVQTGKQPEKDRGADKEYHVFSHEQEVEMINRWTELGMTVTYQRQQVELASRITIAYMKVQNPGTSLSLSIIPWFMVSGRPFPIFVYIYAIGHYKRAEKKSLGESAAAVRKMFGISSFHKSTVSRSIKAMENFLDASRLDRPLDADALKATDCLSGRQAEPDQDYGDVIGYAIEILTAYTSFEELEKELGERTRRLPSPIKRPDRVAHALGGIPDEQFRIIIPQGRGNGPSRDRRKRAPRPRSKGPGHVQRPLSFVDYPQREEKRKAIVAICRRIALDAASTYHHFLV